MQVIINGRARQIDKDELSYDDIVLLAWPMNSHTKALYTVTWSILQSGGRGGTITPGENIKLEPKLVITALITNGA